MSSNEYIIMHGPSLTGAPWYCAWMFWGDLKGLYSISIWAYVSRGVWAGSQTPYKGKAWSRSRCNDCMQHGRGYLLRCSAYLKHQTDASAQEMQKRMGRSRCESENTGTQNRPPESGTPDLLCTLWWPRRKPTNQAFLDTGGFWVFSLGEKLLFLVAMVIYFTSLYTTVLLSTMFNGD